jgi:Flp pilus assembly protein CpaB
MLVLAIDQQHARGDKAQIASTVTLEAKPDEAG